MGNEAPGREMGQEDNGDSGRDDNGYARSKRLWAQFLSGKITASQLSEYLREPEPEVQKVMDYFNAEEVGG